MLFDNHNRPIEYVRLAVTDRCNLRCFYCMPEEGIRYVPRASLMTFEETERVVQVLAAMGIRKVRITGGEPFLRQDLMQLLRAITRVRGIEKVSITTNGLLTAPHLPELMALGIRSLNLSLDSLDRARFFEITRRDAFVPTWEVFQQMVTMGFDVKVNTVVMADKNLADLVPLAELTRDLPVSVRFIEEMPFNGEGRKGTAFWSSRDIRTFLERQFPGLKRVEDPPASTAEHYHVPGFLGTIGIIAAYTRSFCGTCNRIRITAQGMLKTCLYDDGVLNIRDLLRAGLSDAEVGAHLATIFQQRPRDGFEAEARRKGQVSESMSTIGG